MSVEMEWALMDFGSESLLFVVCVLVVSPSGALGFLLLAMGGTGGMTVSFKMEKSIAIGKAHVWKNAE